MAAVGLLVVIALVGTAHGPANAAGRASSTAKVSLVECTKKLNAQDGGWCEMSGATLADVFPKNLSAEIRGWTGPSSVLIAWNGAAWDGARRKWYFHGGGHSDYGGNEVYEFDLDSATFTRLVDPAPIPPSTPALRCPEPAHGPRSQHTYDGFFLSKATDTLWMLPGATGYCLGGMVSLGGQVWEFNPDSSQARNGVPPLTWRRHPVEMPVQLRGSFPRAAELPDETIVVWSNHVGGTLNPRTGEWQIFGSRADWGDGNAVYDPRRNVIWETAEAFLRMAPAGAPQKVSDAVFGADRRGAGIALDDAGDLYVWPGAATVARYEPETGKWYAAQSPKGPDHRDVYSKWIYLPKERMFLGYSRPGTGVWVYKPPKNGWLALPSRSAQSYIDAAPDGSNVTIPPGLYPEGIRIDKNLTVELTGARFERPVDGKANVLVENAKRKIKVVITNYDMPGARLDDNAAAIRTEYDYDLTVRNFHVHGSNMGILTGNRGGRLVLEDGLIEETCCGSDLSHGVYMGVSDELIMRRVTVTNLRRLGHLVKSRAARTTIEDCRLVGGEGRYSRELDAPNGGMITLRRNLIQKGPNTDNADSIAVGTEVASPSKAGQSLHPTSFEFTENTVIFDRKGARSEPAHDAGANEFGKWRHVPAGTPLKVTRNTFVNMKSWGEFPDFSERTGCTLPGRPRGCASATCITRRRRQRASSRRAPSNGRHRRADERAGAPQARALVAARRRRRLLAGGGVERRNGEGRIGNDLPCCGRIVAAAWAGRAARTPRWEADSCCCPGSRRVAPPPPGCPCRGRGGTGPAGGRCS